MTDRRAELTSTEVALSEVKSAMSFTDDDPENLARAALYAMQRLPVEQRMAAMGMVPVAWYCPGPEGADRDWAGGEFVIDRDETPIPDDWSRKPQGLGWPNDNWALLWVEAEVEGRSDD